MTTKREEKPLILREDRFCSQCGNNWTRIHDWNGRRISDGLEIQAPQWYRDGKDGWWCYTCYMREKGKEYGGQLALLRLLQRARERLSE